MALFPIHRYFVYNGNTKPVSEFIPSQNDGGIYEVIRIVEGIPLFLEDHLIRLFHSAQIAHKNVDYESDQIVSYTNNLIEKIGV